MIQKIAIQNYRRFREFILDFDPGMNIIVGDNDSGKSSLIEAINLALTGRVQGRPLSQDFSPFLVNQDATAAYIQTLCEAGDSVPPPPEVVIDLFLDDSDDTEILRGRDNLLDEDACGIRIWGYLNPDYLAEYRSFASQPDQVRLAPTEYYRVDWLGFSGNAVTARSIPATASVIDPTTIRLQSGADYHLQQIIRTHLDPSERVELSRAYRSLREEFTNNPSVEAINEKLAGDDGDVSDKDLTLSIDISRRFTWESSLVAHLDDLPFPFIGKGEQNAVKTLLAIGRKAQDTHIVLVEEPENHLSFSSMRRLIKRIEDRCGDKQVIIATHSSFVLNRLGLDKLVLLGDGVATRMTDLPPDTTRYFKKLSGYDTLRLALAKRAILVEGPSDELIVQRTYRDAHGRLPIDDGIDVINVRGLSFKRFLDLAVNLGSDVTVVTDNDGKTVDEVMAQYADYAEHQNVAIWVADDPSNKTLEPQLVAANDLSLLNGILDKAFATSAELVEYMLDNKTASALAIFEAGVNINMPEYIRGAVA